MFFQLVMQHMGALTDSDTFFFCILFLVFRCCFRYKNFPQVKINMKMKWNIFGGDSLYFLGAATRAVAFSSGFHRCCYQLLVASEASHKLSPREADRSVLYAVPLGDWGALEGGAAVLTSHSVSASVPPPLWFTRSGSLGSSRSKYSGHIYVDSFLDSSASINKKCKKAKLKTFIERLKSDSILSECQKASTLQITKESCDFSTMLRLI